jgi:ankyrin repeat protein
MWTPLQHAYAAGSQKVIDFLIKIGADPTIKDSTGRTAQDISDFLKSSNQ